MAVGLTAAGSLPRLRPHPIQHAFGPLLLRRHCRLPKVAHVPASTEPTTHEVVPEGLHGTSQQRGQQAHHQDVPCACSGSSDLSAGCSGGQSGEQDSTQEHQRSGGQALSSSHSHGHGSVGHTGHSVEGSALNGFANGVAVNASSHMIPASWTHSHHHQQEHSGGAPLQIATEHQMHEQQLTQQPLQQQQQQQQHVQHQRHHEEQHAAVPAGVLHHQQQSVAAAEQSHVVTGTSPESAQQTNSSSSSSSDSSTSSTSTSKPREHQHVPGIPQPVLVLSLVSASLTLASCVFQTLLPIYMVSELKMNLRSLGMFEGLLEAFSYIVRMFSGVVSDMMTSRKSAITLGFAMGAAAKFGMSGATEVGSLFASKALDRLANGVQAAPRDALISDLAPADSRGACFGFAQSMRKWGSALGACLVYFLMRASDNNYRLIFLMAATLSLASCTAFVLLVPSHGRPVTPAPSSASGGAVPPRPSSPLAAIQQVLKGAAGMGPAFFRMQLLVCLYCMGNIGESLLEARAMEVGFGKAESTLVVAALAACIFVVAYPLGRLDDRFGPRVTLAVGMVALILADLVLLLSSTQPWAVFASLAFMAVHYGVTQGPLLSIVVGLAPGHLKGTAFGLFYTTMALTAVCSNYIVGTIWQAHGACAAFMLSAAMTCFTLLVMPWLTPGGGRSPAKAAVPAPA